MMACQAANLPGEDDGEGDGEGSEDEHGAG